MKDVSKRDGKSVADGLVIGASLGIIIAAFVTGSLIVIAIAVILGMWALIRLGRRKHD
jgi:hypothetical protein